MSQRVDRKLREVRVAEYRYRHEAEFAAGFLEDAGIPYRLQIDDAGGADLGLAMLRPAAIWVRSVDVEVARDLLALEEDEDEPVPMIAEVSGSRSLAHRRDTLDEARERLVPQERAVSAGLSLALFSAVPYLPFSPYRTLFGVLCLGCGLGLLLATATGRAPRPLERLIRTLSGSLPR